MSFGKPSIISFLSTALRFLRKDYERNTITIDLIRYIALWGHPLYYLICTVILPQPYESFELRFASPVFFVPILFYKRYPDAFKPLLNIYWYLWLTFTFPFIFTFLMLMNDMSGLWLVAETVMLVTFIIFIPNYFILTFLLLTGIWSAYAAFVHMTGTHLVITTNIIEYFVSIPIAILLGLVLNYTNKKGAMAQEKNRVLQSLAGSIAHEMRNPLGQIRQCLNSIQKILPPFHYETPSVTLEKKSMNDIYHRVAHGQMAVKRGVQVIDMVLGEIRQHPIDPKSFSYLSASGITLKALDEYGYESNEERKRVRLDMQETFIVHISETLFIFVIFNLLKNALYYLGSHSHCEISIRLKKGHEFNSLLFRDTGPGIDEEDLPHIFDSFHTKGKKGGTGLGLSYCKRIMLAFGGDISCVSEKGKFTEFTLSFPVIDNDKIERFNAEVIANALPDFQEKRVLIVDDEEHYRMILQKYMRPLGIEIDEAGSGREAIELVRNNHYDIIIMDLNMPEMSGYTTVEMMRRGEAGPQVRSTPVVAFSAEPAYIAKAMSEKAGMQGLISKPGSQPELINTLRSVLRTGMNKEIEEKLFHRSKVLIVDDSALNRDLLAMSLSDAGLHLAIAVNGQKGWDMLQKDTFDLVITDIHMPEMDGLELTRKLRTSDQAHLRQLPVIGLSGSAEEEKAARQSGMNDFKLKTDSPVIILKAISSQLSTSSESKKGDADKPALMNLKASAQSFGLEQEEMEHLFRTFLDESRNIGEILLNALEEHNIDKVQAEAHKLKGSSSLFQAESVRAAAENIEQSCRSGKTDDLKNQIEELVTAMDKLSKQPV